MPRNIEIKARLTDRSNACAIAACLSGRDPELIEQRDVFFMSAQGRLKLRLFPDGSGELIQYHRPDTASIKLSDYRIARTPDAGILLEILRQTVTVLGEVRKHRLLYLVGQTRVHIDDVHSLGDFLELEVVLRPDQDAGEGSRIADHLIEAFGIRPAELVGGAYIDLIAATHSTIKPGD